MKITITAPVTHLCPYRDEVDEGTVDLTFIAEEGDAPELHALAIDLMWAKDIHVSHEEWSRHTLNMTCATRIVSRWKTAGLDVTCDLSRESDR